MSTRRAFIKGAGALAGVVFTGCSALDAQQSRSQMQIRTAGRRREVAVNAQRVKTIDVHAHCVVPEAMKLMGSKDAADQAKGNAMMKQAQMMFEALKNFIDAFGKMAESALRSAGSH